MLKHLINEIKDRKLVGLMARLLNEDEMIKNRVDDFIEKSTSEFTKFLETTPLFVTYYQLDKVNSTRDHGLQHIEDFLGADSPNRYNKIEKFPLYAMEMLSLNNDFGSIGMSSDQTGSGVIIPNTIRPYPEDLLTLDGHVGIFIVTSVQEDTVKNKPFYRIEFSKYNDESNIDIDDQVTDEYVSVFDNIGTHNDSVLLKSDYLIVDALEKMIEEMVTRYIRNFYRKDMNVITLQCATGHCNLYNRSLNRFIMNNDLLKIEKGFRTDLYLTDMYQDSASDFDMYRNSIYYALEKKNTRGRMFEHCRILGFDSVYKVNPFTHYGRNYACAVFNDVPSDESVVIFTPGLVDHIRTGELFTLTEETPSKDEAYDVIDEFNAKTGGLPFEFKVRRNTPVIDFNVSYPFNYIQILGGYVVENIIIDYMNDRLQIDEHTIDLLNELDFSFDLYCYSMVPLLIYVLKEYKKNIQKTIL